MRGRIHSIETCGAVDGPGLRYIIFTQGCLLRCQYCHNPDTWKIRSGKEMTVQEILQDIKDFLPFFKATGGGVTVSGGEPLLQIDFLAELFKELKKMNVHTAIDTSGGCFNRAPHFLKKLDEVRTYTDLVLLDLKHIHQERHKDLTGVSNAHILDFATYLSENQVPVWIRHVLVPTINDQEEYLHGLADFIQTLSNVEKVEVLPYHLMGVYKWRDLGLSYKLDGIEPPSQEHVTHARQILNHISH